MNTDLKNETFIFEVVSTTNRIQTAVFSLDFVAVLEISLTMGNSQAKVSQKPGNPTDHEGPAKENPLNEGLVEGDVDDTLEYKEDPGAAKKKTKIIMDKLEGIHYSITEDKTVANGIEQFVKILNIEGGNKMETLPQMVDKVIMISFM